MTVTDRSGRVISRESRQSRSYVRQLVDFFYFLCDNVNRALTDRAGASQTLKRDQAGANLFRFDGVANDDDRGIIYGTGSTAVDISDSDLDTAIAEGTGSGQLSHQEETFTAPAVAGSTCSYTTTRAAINGSGAAISVAEIGIAVQAQNTALSLCYFLIIRDVLASAQNVPDGGAITVIYTIFVTV